MKIHSGKEKRTRLQKKRKYSQLFLRKATAGGNA
jgi:hypothetical protein